MTVRPAWFTATVLADAAVMSAPLTVLIITRKTADLARHVALAAVHCAALLLAQFPVQVIGPHQVRAHGFGGGIAVMRGDGVDDALVLGQGQFSAPGARTRVV
jgi:hypothetical protein